MQRHLTDGPVHYTFDSLSAESGLAHGVFTRLGGVSEAPYQSLNVGLKVGDNIVHVRTNINRIAGILGADDRYMHTTWQVHGADVVVYRRREPQAWPPPSADAMITAQPGLPLMMRFADCVPILLFDPVRHVLGMAHAGWRGTLARVAAATVETMAVAFGSRPADIVAGIGPSIGPAHYEVGREVLAHFESAFESATGTLFHWPNGAGDESRPHLNLWAANRLVLEQAGVRRIEEAGLCTVEHVHEFFSHRAENGLTGRFALAAMLT